MDDLESLYGTGLNHTVITGGALHDRAMRTAKVVGLPAVSGGGLRPVLLYPGQYKGATAPREASKSIPDPYKISKGAISYIAGKPFTGAGSTLTPVDGGVPDLNGGDAGDRRGFGNPSLGDLDDMFSGLDLSTPERPGRGSQQNPAGSAWSNNPGGSMFQLEQLVNPNAASGVQQFGLGASPASAEGSLSGNPGGKTSGYGDFRHTDFNDLLHAGTGDALADEALGYVGALANAQGSPTRPGAGMGTEGGLHVWTRPGGGGDPLDDTPDGGTDGGTKAPPAPAKTPDLSPENRTTFDRQI